jgi:hypothetical protein
VSTETDLEALSSRELHDMAVRRALHHADVAFLWELLRSIPAAEALEGDVGESEADATKVSALLADALESGKGEIADALRPLYIDYLTKHPPRS